jgi:hypothetical protein
MLIVRGYHNILRKLDKFLSWSSYDLLGYP